MDEIQLMLSRSEAQSLFTVLQMARQELAKQSVTNPRSIITRDVKSIIQKMAPDDVRGYKPREEKPC